MTTQSGLQSRQQRHALFAQRGQIAANAAKGLGTSHATEATGDLLLHFDHAKISLGKIVVKIHAKIFQEAEESMLVFAQPIKQIASGTLFAAPSSTRRRQGMRMKAISFLEQFEEVGLPIDDFQRVQPALSLLPCLLGGLLHLQEQLFEVCGLPHPLFFCQKHQLAQQIHDASGVLAVIQEVRSPSIVDRDAAELRQDANGFQGRLTSAQNNVIVGEGRRAGDVHPVSEARHMQTRFILVNDLSVLQRRFDLLLHRGQLPRTAFDQLPERPFAHLHSQQIAHHLARSRQRQQLLLHQIHGSCANRWPALDGSGNLFGKRSSIHVLSHRALFLFSAVFSHDQTRRGNIEDLSALNMRGRNRVQIVLTGFTLLNVVLDHFIWGGGPLQTQSFMSWLPSRWLLALLAQAFRLAHKPIRGRRQVAIVAIFRQLVPQAFHLRAQSTDLVTHVLNLSILLVQTPDLLAHLLDQRILLPEHLLLPLDDFITPHQLLSQDRILFSQMLLYFFNRHALTLLGLTSVGKSPADLGSYPTSCSTRMCLSQRLLSLLGYTKRRNSLQT